MTRRFPFFVPPQSRYLTLDSGSGQITLRRPPPPGLSALNVTVSARDLGSPAYRDVAGVQITFRTISGETLSIFTFLVVVSQDSLLHSKMQFCCR